MTASHRDSAALIERERQLKDDVFPYVVSLPNFLGNVDYGTDFYRFIRPGQVNWEFHDKKKGGTFHAFLVGEIADASHGTRLGALGNKRRSEDQGYPFRDGTKIKNVTVLRCPSGSTTYGTNAFNNQFVALEQVVAHVNADDNENEKPTNGLTATWVDSSVAFTETRRPTDLIVVSLPRKYDSPSADSSRKRPAQVAKRLPVTEKEDDVQCNSVNRGKKIAPKTEEKVIVGERYDPALLPDFSSNDLAFIHDRLVQHDIRDIDGDLIAAWNIAEGLRPGTVVGVKAALHVYNIPNQRAPGFRRFYQIDAEVIRVMSEAILPPAPQIIDPPPYSSTSTTVDDFTSYRVSKRPATGKEVIPRTKINKLDHQHDVHDDKMQL